MNILVVEDESQIAKGIKASLQKHLKANIVSTANNYLSGLNKFKENIYDIVILDINFNKDEKNGLDLLKQIRIKNPNIPIIMLTAFKDTKYLKKAFELNASDYIKKPFDPIELCIRIKHWQKIRPKIRIHKNLKYHELELKIATNEVFFDNKKINLSKKNKFLLKIFLQKPETLIKQDYIQEKIYGDHSCLEKQRNIRSNIQHLRMSLNCHCKNWIKTVRGEGYLLKKD